jgi:Holliday junction resolvase RusA-like endonuclease
VKITLPWPSAKLNPNQSKGRHWGATTALRKGARSDAFALTYQAMSVRQFLCPGPVGTVPLTITFVQPDKRARDRDNLLAALKPSLDGMADALGVNDSQFEPITIRREYGARPGCVVVEVG